VNLVVDAGGTNLRAKIFIQEESIKSFNAKSDEVPLAKWIETIIQSNPNIKTISISYAGQVRNGKILYSPNIKVDVHDIRQYFSTKYNLPLFIENDLTCAVLAEAKAHKSDNLSALYVGTGLGLGVVDNGKIVKGAQSISTEIGHIPYKDAPFKCGCGRENCIELFASGNGIKKWMKEYNLTCKATFTSLKENRNIKAKIILDEFEKALLYSCGNVITLFNPDILVLGGGILHKNPYLLQLIKENIDKYALNTSIKNLKIVLSNLSEAPLLGALLLKDLHI